MVKKPRLARTLPAPPQVGHCLGLVPDLAPVPEHTSQAMLAGTRISAALPVKDLVERDLHIVAQVGTALAPERARSAAAAASAHELAEQVVEDVRHRGGEVRAEAAASAHAVIECGVAEFVVGRALLRILQGLVGLVQLLEVLFGGLVPGVFIGVTFLGELAEARTSSPARWRPRWTPRTS